MSMTVKTIGKETKEGGEEVSRELTLEMDLAENLADETELVGEALVFSLYTKQKKVRFQAAVRLLIDKGKTDEEIADELSGWDPSQSLRTHADPEKKMASIMKFIETCAPETREQLLEQVRGKLGV